MDMAQLMALFQGGGAAAGATPPMANPGAATPPTGAGFGIGQPLVQAPAVPGQDAQMAGNPQAGGLAGMMGAGGQMDPDQMKKMLMLAQMMQQQGQGQAQGQMGGGGMGAMMQGRPAGNNTQAGRGYLASGGGLAQRAY